MILLSVLRSAPSLSSVCEAAAESWGTALSSCLVVLVPQVGGEVGRPDYVTIAGVAAGLGAVAAALIATVNIRVDYVARRDQRISALVAHFMSPEVANARDLVTTRESRRHTDASRHAVFLLLWTIERVGADIDALRPSWATKVAYSQLRQPRQASGVEVLYANIARVTRSLNRYFESDAANDYFDGSVATANRVLGRLPDWYAISGGAIDTQIVSTPPSGQERQARHIYKLLPPANAFRPPRGTGKANRFQKWKRDMRARQRA